MSVNLEYYKTFFYVAELGSMGKAAERMCLTPPTVTKAIQSLEQQLNCQLFVRTVKGVHLTSAGELLYKRVKPGLNLLLSGENEIKLMNSLEYGTVRIGMSEAAANYFTLNALFTTFSKQYPKICLQIKHQSFSEAHSGLINGEIDCAILGVFPDPVKGIHFHKLYDSPNIPVVGKDYAFLAEQAIPLKELNEYPLIFVRSGYSIRKYYEDIYKRHDLTFSPTIETPTLHMQTQAVKTGLGYSFLPLPYIQDAIEAGQLFQLTLEDEPHFQRPVCLLTVEDYPMSKAAEALIQVLLSMTA